MMEGSTLDILVFGRLVICERMLIVLSGKRFVWDKVRGRFVLAAKVQTNEGRRRRRR